MRPALKTPIDVNGYDVVFVGYPLWWETAPRVVRTFLKSEDWADEGEAKLAKWVDGLGL